MDRPHNSPRLLEFTRLIPDSVGIAMRSHDPTDFLGWVLDHLPAYATFDSPVHGNPTLARALAFAWTRAIWNGLPLNSAGVKPPPMHSPGSDDVCPCGSGVKFKLCCLALPAVPTLTTDALWPYVLANMAAADRDGIISGNRVSRSVLIEFAAHLLETNRREEVIAALEPRFSSPERYNDEDAAILLHLLCDAYGTSPQGTRCKLKVLEMTVEKAPRSALRAEAWQRLSTIYMDRGDSERAWDAFHAAQDDNPQSETLCVLEVELLTAEHQLDKAREHAKFWLERLQRGGTSRDDPRMEFLTRIALGTVERPVTKTTPLRGVGQALRHWLERVKDRDVPRYTLRPAAAPTYVLTAPRTITSVERQWHEAFPLEKPFATQDQLFGGGDVWEEALEARWCSFLEKHPNSFDSVDILDDLATGIGRHPHSGSQEIETQLLTIVLARNEAIVERACASLGKSTLTWANAVNRCALRGLMRLLQSHAAHQRTEQVHSLADRMLKLNPGDHYRVRELLRQIRG